MDATGRRVSQGQQISQPVRRCLSGWVRTRACVRAYVHARKCARMRVRVRACAYLKSVFERFGIRFMVAVERQLNVYKVYRYFRTHVQVFVHTCINECAHTS